MPAPHDLDPDAMTEAERLTKRRFEAGFAFETMPEPHPSMHCLDCDFTTDVVYDAAAHSYAAAVPGTHHTVTR